MQIVVNFFRPESPNYPTLEAYFDKELCILEGPSQAGSTRKTLLTVFTDTPQCTFLIFIAIYYNFSCYAYEES